MEILIGLNSLSMEDSRVFFVQGKIVTSIIWIFLGIVLILILISKIDRIIDVIKFGGSYSA